MKADEVAGWIRTAPMAELVRGFVPALRLASDAHDDAVHRPVGQALVARHDKGSTPDGLLFESVLRAFADSAPARRGAGRGATDAEVQAGTEDLLRQLVKLAEDGKDEALRALVGELQQS